MPRREWQEEEVLQSQLYALGDSRKDHGIKMFLTSRRAEAPEAALPVLATSSPSAPCRLVPLLVQ